MNEITITPADSSVLEVLPSREMRETAIYLLASDLGIPVAYVDDPRTRLDAETAIMRALYYRLTYGAIPGVHVHAVKRSQTIDVNGRKEKVDLYTVQDGEKMWKDSLARAAEEQGFRYVFDDQRMDTETLHAEIRAMGYKDPIPANAIGYYSRVITSTHREFGVEPIRVPGLWFGKIKHGKWWNDDNLPTGVTGRDVAIRRAHKRAIMTSEITLRPLDNLNHGERTQQFVNSMTSRIADKDRSESMPLQSQVTESEIDIIPFDDAQPLPTPRPLAERDGQPFAVQDETQYNDGESIKIWA